MPEQALSLSLLTALYIRTILTNRFPRLLVRLWHRPMMENLKSLAIGFASSALIIWLIGWPLYACLAGQ